MGRHGRQRMDLILVRAKTLEVKRDKTTVVDIMSMVTNIPRDIWQYFQS